MGFLHQLWDETLAGPAPESGLSQIRKYSSFSYATRSSPSGDPAATVANNHGDPPVSRSITILRTNSNSAAALRNLNVNVSSPDSGSIPSSPSAPSSPVSPLSPTTPRGHFKKLTRRKSTSEALQRRTPTGYDWIVLSALDR